MSVLITSDKAITVETQVAGDAIAIAANVTGNHDVPGDTTATVRGENRPDAFLRKPFVPPTLLKCIQKVLASEGPVNCEE